MFHILAVSELLIYQRLKLFFPNMYSEQPVALLGDSFVRLYSLLLGLYILEIFFSHLYKIFHHQSCSDASIDSNLRSSHSVFSPLFIHRSREQRSSFFAAMICKLCT